MAKAAPAGAPTSVQQFAAWVTSLDSRSIGKAEIDQAKLLVLDTIGCAFGGWHEAEGLVAAVESMGGAAQCQVIGAPWRTSIANAVLANGTLCRVLDLNDYVLSREGNEIKLGGHPSDNIPVALAFAEKAGRYGLELLASIVIGYEIVGRAKDLGGDDGEWDGVSYSGLVAPAMGSRLLGFDARQTSHAIALSLARCATSTMVRWGDLSAAKSIANSLVARTGSEAVLLAEHGVTGPLAILDHERGMHSLFPNRDAIAGLFAPMPANGYILKASIKPYPAVATSQSAIAAGLALHEKMGGDTSSIERVKVVVADYPTIRRHVGNKERADPKSKEAADHSIPFLISVAIVDGALSHAQFENERWNKPDVRKLMATMEFSPDADITRRAPDSFPCRLEAIDRAGNRHISEILFPPGLSRGGLAEADVVAKFHRVTDGIISTADRDRIIDAVMTLPTAANIEPLTAAIAARRRH